MQHRDMSRTLSIKIELCVDQGVLHAASGADYLRNAKSWVQEESARSRGDHCKIKRQQRVLPRVTHREDGEIWKFESALILYQKCPCNSPAEDGEGRTPNELQKAVPNEITKV